MILYNWRYAVLAEQHALSLSHTHTHTHTHTRNFVGLYNCQAHSTRWYRTCIDFLVLSLMYTMHTPLKPNDSHCSSLISKHLVQYYQLHSAESSSSPFSQTSSYPRHALSSSSQQPSPPPFYLSAISSSAPVGFVAFA